MIAVQQLIQLNFENYELFSRNVCWDTPKKLLGFFYKEHVEDFQNELSKEFKKEYHRQPMIKKILLHRVTCIPALDICGLYASSKTILKSSRKKFLEDPRKSS